MLPNDNNYMLYRLTWNAERNKFDKKPCNLDGSSLHEGQPIPTAARDAITVPDGCALGYWLTEAAGLFFIDLDECVTDGQLSPDAARIAAPFVNAGCFFEASSSGRGAHIIGRYTGNLPAHCNRRPTVHKYEFYTRDRGIALNLDRATGSANVDATAAVLALLPEVFPPRAVTVTMPVGQRRPEWRGPEDDDELIRRALSATGSAAARFGGKASFADLWEGRVEANSEADMALASHLAFWTGCDVDRIERLMRRSGLARPKWNEHRTYLRDITITHACATTTNVYKEPERKDMITAVLGAPGDVDWFALADQKISEINNSGTLKVLMHDIVPTIGPLSFPTVHAQRIATVLNKRLELFDAKMPIGAVRQLVTPPTVMTGALVDSQPPEWFAGMCYVRRNDKFYNVNTGSEYTAEGFRTEFSRFMPFKQNGTREDPVAYARERWNIVTVDDTMYRPGFDQFFDYAGRQYANTFNPATMPPMVEPTSHCAMCIQAFQNHLYLLCGQRDWLYVLLLQWLAHNVQHPGHKIRWSPLIKGVQGDGKSIVGDLIFAAMGEANVKITAPSNISNKGGFTDWATGKAVNFIEEIRLEGREKHALYNAMKLFIGDTRTDLNRKGRAAGDTMPNITNHWANSNYGDAVPVDDKERRWLIVFSPYTTIDEAVRAKGLPDVDSLVRHFKMLGTSMRSEPGAWRTWLMGIDTSSFDPDGRAPDTPERESMRLMSGNTLDQTIVDILEAGGHGITKDCFSSSCLMGMVKIRAGENPDNRGWNSTLTRLGYIQMTKTVWWSGSSHRIWAKKQMTNEEIREKLG